MPKRKTTIEHSDIKQVQEDITVRRHVAKKSFRFFFELHFAHYITAPFAKFHKEMFHHIQNPKERFVAIMAFRGSGKSSIVSTAFPIWSILGHLENKFVVIVAQTQQQARLYMRNLKDELETNSLLKKDLGPFVEESDEWNNSSIVLRKFGARITVISVDQSVRGIRHKSHRPDLVILDDVENIQSMKTKDGRDNLYEWFTKELIPLGEPKKTRFVIVGNMLHRDSLLMRLKGSIDDGVRSGVFLRYPIVQNEKSMWPERYSLEDIQQIRMDIGSEIAWRMEYMLEDAGYEGQVVDPSWIHWYDDFPEPAPSMISTHNSVYSNSLPHPIDLATGVDLAISESNAADYTAFVTGWEWGRKEHKIVFVVDAFAKKMDFSQTADTLASYHRKQSGEYEYTKHEVVLETVGYQAAMEQYLRKNQDMDILGIKPRGSKRERLALITDLIKTGRILFPRTEAGVILVEQILGFGKERHDDLVDAFTLMINHVFSKKDNSIGIWWI